MITGGCQCGAVRYEIAAPFENGDHCHCSMCRKSHGAAFATYGNIPRANLRFVKGEGDLTHYKSSPKVTRSFCRHCGSPMLFDYHPMPDRISVSFGTLDGDPGVRPQCHIFVGSKAVWYEIADGLPRHDTFPS